MPRRVFALTIWVVAAALASAQSVTLTQLSTPFNTPIGIDYHEPTNTLIVSSNYPSGIPNNLERVAFDGTRIPYSGLSGLTDELKIATVRSSGNPGGFVVGDVFTGNGNDGEIVRVTNGGATVMNPWVSLPGSGNGLMRGSLYIDRTGVYGGDLIVCTTGGEVWRIDNAGNPTFIADVNTHLEGMITVPDDATRFGPLAGKIICGAENQGLVYAFDATGAFTTYSFGVNVEDIDLIGPNESFFGVNFGTGKLLAASAAQFASMTGDILLTQEFHSGTGLFHLHWDGAAFQVTHLAAGAGSAPIGQWEHVSFAPVGVAPFPSCSLSATQLGASVGVPTGFTAMGQDADPNDVVTLTASGVPAGATFTPALPASGNPVSSTFSWTPTNADVGTHFIVVTATDSSGLQSSCTVQITVAECFLLASLTQVFVPLSPNDPGDVLLVRPDRVWPVTLTDIPLLQVPPYAGLNGVHVYLQVAMYNPYVFPNDPLQLTDCLDCVLGGASSVFGPTNGMHIWSNQPAVPGGVIDVGFSIPGM